MKVLWIVNTIFPFPAKKIGRRCSVFGGWMSGLMNSIIEDRNIELAVATTYDGKDLKCFSDNKVMYYLLPCKNNCKYDARLEKYWKEVNDSFKPDIVHLHGTEFSHGLVFLKTCPEVKSIASIQGLVSLYGGIYLMGISHKDIINNITFRDVIRFDNMYQAKKKFLERGKNEIKILKMVDGIVGRTTWDYAAVMEYSDISKYFHCNESLRDSFYQVKWNYSKIEKNTIFISQASYPIKGFHEMIKALPIIKKYYPNVKVYVAGSNIIDKSTAKKRFALSGYGKYLLSLIKKYQIQDNIEFVGLLNEIEMVNKMLKCNVFVQASIIENSPNSLGEAMLIGMPIVASNVGGTSDMLIDKKEGYLYPYGEENLLAKYVMDIFSDEKKSVELGINAQNHALKTHDRKKNMDDMLKIYRSLIDETKK